MKLVKISSPEVTFASDNNIMSALEVNSGIDLTQIIFYDWGSSMNVGISIVGLMWDFVPTLDVNQILGRILLNIRSFSSFLQKTAETWDALTPGSKNPHIFVILKKKCGSADFQISFNKVY